MTPPTIPELLYTGARDRRDQVVYTYLTFDGAEPRRMTRGDLYGRASAIAQELVRLRLQRQPILLVYGADLDFAPAFFGVMLAGGIAVPVPMPLFAAQYARLDRIAADYRPGALLTTEASAARLMTKLPVDSPLHGCPWLTTDRCDPSADLAGHAPDPSAVALLQYTSGSTAEPRGVAVTHGNLAHNLEMLVGAFDGCPGTRVVSWLPHFHDMGLIVGTIGPVKCGGDAILMSPQSFLQRPRRWLEAVSTYRGQVSGAPNFAYELCLKAAAEDGAEALDLSCWRSAFVGAEPIRSSTLAAFAARFEPDGFDPRALTPCYGMAEATLMVTCQRIDTAPASYSVSRTALDEGCAVPSRESSALTLVGCGAAAAGTDVRIVDPRRRVALPRNRVGEIWVAGPHVASGYWRGVDRDVFEGRLAGSGEGPFLRTGDLGFMTPDGDVVFVDRLKDLVVVNGQNYVCHDLELTAASSHALLSADACVAVSVDAGDRPAVVVIAEFPRHALECAPETARAIRAGLLTTHALPVATVAFVGPRKLSRTTSGKLQRRLTARRFMDGSLPVMAQYGSQHGEGRLTP